MGGNPVKWSLENSCEGKFHVGQRVKTRSDMGGFNLTIVAIHNHHYCTVMGYRASRHMNMNCLEPSK